MVNQNLMMQAALEYAAKGFPVFPLIVGGKRPLGSHAPNGCKDATTDEDQICEWWEAEPDANIGIATDKMCVVDIDGADHPWLSDGSRLEALSIAPASQTPRGGRHYLFRQNGESLRNTAGKLADHVDTRADGGYIVAAPSVVDGKPYQWLSELDSRDELPTVPEWITQGLQVVNEGPVKLEGNKIPKGIQHNTLFRIACRLRRMGLTFPEINVAIQTVNMQRCEEPGTYGDIEKIAESAAKYTPDMVTVAEIEGMEDEPEGPKFTWITASELSQQDFVEDWIIEKIMVAIQPFMIIGGDKTCKTSTAVDMALSIATETDYLGKFKVPRKRNVLMLTSESGVQAVKNILLRAATARGLRLEEIDNLFLSFDIGSFDTAEDIAEVEQVIKDKNAEVLFIDPVYLNFSNIGESASSMFEVGKKLKKITELGMRTNCTIILIHHTKKPTPQNQFTEPEMSDAAFSGWTQWMRQWQYLKRREKYQPDKPGVHKLWFNCGGSYGHSEGWALDIDEGSLDDPGGRKWDVTLFPADDARSEKENRKAKRDEIKKQNQLIEDMDKVRQAIETLGEPSPASKIRDCAKLSTQRTNVALLELQSEGEVECEGLKAGNGHTCDHYSLIEQTEGRGGIQRDTVESRHIEATAG